MSNEKFQEAGTLLDFMQRYYNYHVKLSTDAALPREPQQIIFV